MTTRLTGAEALQFFVAAMQAVAPDGLHAVEVHSGEELWDRVVHLAEADKGIVTQVLDGMLRERATAPES